MTNANNKTYRVKLEYFNGQTWIENKVVIDTGTLQRHCVPLHIPVITASEYNFVTYDGRKSTLNQKSKIMMKTPSSILVEYECYIDHSIPTPLSPAFTGFEKIQI